MNIFDFNNDGKVDLFEMGLATEVFGKGENIEDLDMDNLYDFDDEDISELIEELDMYGFDVDDLYMMDEDERNELLESEGLVAEDYDILFKDE